MSVNLMGAIVTHFLIFLIFFLKKISFFIFCRLRCVYTSSQHTTLLCLRFSVTTKSYAITKKGRSYFHTTNWSQHNIKNVVSLQILLVELDPTCCDVARHIPIYHWFSTFFWSATPQNIFKFLATPQIIKKKKFLFSRKF